jgi:hypothetical protein
VGVWIRSASPSRSLLGGGVCKPLPEVAFGHARHDSAFPSKPTWNTAIDRGNNGERGEDEGGGGSDLRACQWPEPGGSGRGLQSTCRCGCRVQQNSAVQSVDSMQFNSIQSKPMQIQSDPIQSNPTQRPNKACTAPFCQACH